MESFRNAFNFINTCAKGALHWFDLINGRLLCAYENVRALQTKARQWTIYWMLLISVSSESIDLNGAKWKLLALTPGIMITVIIFSWFNYHFTNAFLVSLPLSIFIAVPLNFIVCKNKFCRSVFFLTFYDLSLRFLRMYCVQLVLCISPFGYVEEMLNLLVTAMDCSSDTAIDKGRNASLQVTNQAASVGKSFLTAVSNVTSQIGQLVSPTIDSIEEVMNSTSSILQDLSSTKENCRAELDKLKSECAKMALEALNCRTAYGPLLGHACNLITPVSGACQKLKEGHICDALMIGDFFDDRLGDVQTALNSFKQELVVELEFQSETNMTDNNFFTEIRNDFKADIGKTFGIVWYWYQIFGYLLAMTIFYSVVKNCNVLKKFRETGTFGQKKISKFLLYTNPFVFQFIFICFNGVADGLLRLLYAWQKQKLNQKRFEFNFNFFADVLYKNGGTIAMSIANLFGESLLEFEPINISENLGKCFEKELPSPAFFTYFLSLLICYVGYKSYNILGLHNRQQELIIDIAYARWGFDSDSTIRRIDFLFPSENIGIDNQVKDHNHDQLVLV